jgi:hypothetical protein
MILYNLFYILLGILLIFLCVLFLKHEIRHYNKLKENDYMKISFFIGNIFGALSFLIIGIIIIYNSLKKLF